MMMAHKKRPRKDFKTSRAVLSEVECLGGWGWGGERTVWGEGSLTIIKSEKNFKVKLGAGRKKKNADSFWDNYKTQS